MKCWAGRLVLAVVVWVGVLGVCFGEGSVAHAEGEEDSSTAIVERISENLNKYNSFYLKCHVMGEGRVSRNGEDWTRTLKSGGEHELFYDGDGGRFSNRGYRWGDMDSSGRFVEKEQADYVRILYDGKTLKGYNEGVSTSYPPYYTINPTMSEERTRQVLKRSVARWQGSNVLGYFSNDERLDVILRQADALHVSGAREKVNDSECYVLEATSKGARYKLWIDRAHDYNLAKAIVSKRSGAWWGSTQLVVGESIQWEVNVASYKNVGGVWVVSDAEIVRKDNIQGRKSLSRAQYKMVEVRFAPDFDGLGAFSEDDVKNGTKVFIRGLDGISYTWRDGKVVDGEGRELDIKGKVEREK